MPRRAEEVPVVSLPLLRSPGHAEHYQGRCFHSMRSIRTLRANELQGRWQGPESVEDNSRRPTLNVGPGPAVSTGLSPGEEMIHSVATSDRFELTRQAGHVAYRDQNPGAPLGRRRRRRPHSGRDAYQPGSEVMDGWCERLKFGEVAANLRRGDRNVSGRADLPENGMPAFPTPPAPRTRGTGGGTTCFDSNSKPPFGRWQPNECRFAPSRAS